MANINKITQKMWEIASKVFLFNPPKWQLWKGQCLSFMHYVCKNKILYLRPAPDASSQSSIPADSWLFGGDGWGWGKAGPSLGHRDSRDWGHFVWDPWWAEMEIRNGYLCAALFSLEKCGDNFQVSSNLGHCNLSYRTVKAFLLSQYPRNLRKFYMDS